MSGRNIEKRGRSWYLRWRVPKKYRTVETRAEINISLGTDSETEAQGLAVIAKSNLKAEWDALLASKVPTQDREKFDSMMALARSKRLPFATPEQIATGTMEEITRRLDLVRREPVDSPMVAAALGGIDLPSILVSEMAPEMARIRSDGISCLQFG
jgi:hypothetical protein